VHRHVRLNWIEGYFREYERCQGKETARSGIR